MRPVLLLLLLLPMLWTKTRILKTFDYFRRRFLR
jgi:hypothetical protein